jgi:uncharacterized protein YgbK (DUF1537 family)
MTDARPLPGGLLLAYYGDDFTGSTDTMEVMAFAGLPTVLFLDDPTPERMARFPSARAVGIAGVSRSRDPAWMEAHLPGRFASLGRLGAPVLQYKVCSTFDSAPHMGSIGKAVDLGVAHAPGRFTPMIVGAPRLRRFQAFGNLFATIDDVGYRLDRHPTMARHPVTPMGEADLALHLSHQTERRIALVHLVQLKQGRGAERLAALAGDDIPVVLIDVLDDETLAEAGRLVWENRGTGLFTASSSGLQYALVAYWRACGALPPRGAADARLGRRAHRRRQRKLLARHAGADRLGLRARLRSHPAGRGRGGLGRGRARGGALRRPGPRSPGPRARPARLQRIRPG